MNPRPYASTSRAIDPFASDPTMVPSFRYADGLCAMSESSCAV